MRRPSAHTRQLSKRPNPAETLVELRADQSPSRWRALEREQFRKLVASPNPDDRIGTGEKSC